VAAGKISSQVLISQRQNGKLGVAKAKQKTIKQTKNKTKQTNKKTLS